MQGGDILEGLLHSLQGRGILAVLTMHPCSILQMHENVQQEGDAQEEETPN